MMELRLPLTSDGKPIIVFDPLVRRRFAAEAKWWEHALYQTNSWGWREFEYPLESSAEMFRIIVIGDSFAENYQKEWDKSIAKELERQLNISQPTEVICLAMRGFNLIDYLNMAIHEAPKYSPDLIIVLLFTFNDLKPYLLEVTVVEENKVNFSPWKQQKARIEFERYLDAPDCRVTWEEFEQARRSNRILTRIGQYGIYEHFYHLGLKASLRENINRLVYRIRRKSYYLQRILEPGLQVYRNPPSDGMLAVWDLAKHTLNLLSKSTPTTLPLVVVSLTNAEQLYPDLLCEETRMLGLENVVLDVTFPDTMLEEHCRTVGAEFISTYQALRSASNLQLFDNYNPHLPPKDQWWGHYTVEGNIMIARHIATSLKHRGLLDSRPTQQ